MRRSKGQRRRNVRNVLLGIGAIAIALTVAGGATAYFLFWGPETLDRNTLCPTEGASGQVVLLVDKTDPLSFTQKEAFQQFLNDLGRKEVAKGEQLSVFVLGEDFRETPEPLFEMCNPGRGEDVSIWTGNPERIRWQYEEEYVAPLCSVENQLISEDSAHFSPLMEMLQMVAINGFRKSEIHGPRRLIVVSDMLQNTPECSHYRGGMDFEAFRKSPYYQKVWADLSGVEVTLFYLMHTPELQTRRNSIFWEKYFRDMNARVVSVDKLEG